MTLDPTKLYELEIAPGIQRTLLLAPYDVTLTFKEGFRVAVGRFSLALLPSIKLFGSHGADTVLTVGCFCEAAEGASIVAGGEHRNAGLLNYTFGGQGKIFRIFMDEEAQRLGSVEPPAPIVIGDNVIISTGATILGGTSIGAGSIVAAGAVVTRDCPPLGVYGGVPARQLRPRFGPEDAELYRAIRLPEVMAHHLAELPTLLNRLQTREIGLDDYYGRVSFLPVRPVVHCLANVVNGQIQLAGVTSYALGDKPITDEAILRQLNGYFGQMGSSEARVKWATDIFRFLGLY